MSTKSNKNSVCLMHIQKSSCKWHKMLTSKQEKWRPEVMEVGDLLHAEPTELSSADSTRHVITRAIVHLDDKRTAARTRLDFICTSNATHHLHYTVHNRYIM